MEDTRNQNPQGTQNPTEPKTPEDKTSQNEETKRDGDVRSEQYNQDIEPDPLDGG